MAKLLVLTAKSDAGFQWFVQTARYWEMNAYEETHQISIKML